MKYLKRQNARKLRSEGYSLKEIAEKLKLSKGSVSVWVRDIELSLQQRQRLTSKNQSLEIVERRRATRLKNELTKREVIIKSAEKQVPKLSKKELWLIGTMLYWAEGGKTKGIVRFSNSDPNMITTMMVFFRSICNVSENNFRGYIHIHPHLDHLAAEDYWSKISGIRKEHFYKTYRKAPASSQSKHNNLPYGTFDIYICDTKLLLTITGWAKGIFGNYLSSDKIV